MFSSCCYICVKFVLQILRIYQNCKFMMFMYSDPIFVTCTLVSLCLMLIAICVYFWHWFVSAGVRVGTYVHQLCSQDFDCFCVAYNYTSKLLFAVYLVNSKLFEFLKSWVELVFIEVLLLSISWRRKTQRFLFFHYDIYQLLLCCCFFCLFFLHNTRFEWVCLKIVCCI